MKDNTSKVVLKRWKEVSELPPQNLGFFDALYHSVSRIIKSHPILTVILLGASLLMVFRIGFGFSLVWLTSVLQRGF
jgi:hypothetical protein